MRISILSVMALTFGPRKPIAEPMPLPEEDEPIAPPHAASARQVEEVVEKSSEMEITGSTSSIGSLTALVSV